MVQEKQEVANIRTFKVLSVCQAFGGGVLRALSQIVSHLDSKTFEHHVAWSQREETPADWQREFPPGTIFHHWNCQREINLLKDAVALYQLLQIVRQVQPDLIHAHSSKSGIVRLLAPLIPGVPIIYTPHAFSFLHSTKKWGRWAYLGAEWMLARFPSDIIGVSRSEAESARVLGCSSEYINNMCDAEAITRIVSTLPPRAPRGKPLVGMAGRGLPQKNPDLFMDVARRLEREMDFLWIGYLPEQYLMDRPANLKVTGWLEWEQVIRQIAQVDIYLHTALWEGVPMTVLEAMAAKRPVVAYPGQGTTDAVEQGVTGLLASDADGLANSIRLVRRCPNLADILGQQGYDRVTRNFESALFTKQWTDAYLNRIRSPNANLASLTTSLKDVRQANSPI